MILRVPTRGRLGDLISCYEAQRRPSAGYFCSYSEVRPLTDKPSSRFGSLLTFRLTGPGLPLTAAHRLTSAIRQAAMERSEFQPAPEILSGHSTDGRPSQRDHVAYVPLAFVDHRFADGRIRGFAVVMPKGTPADERRIVIRALASLETVYFDRDWEWRVEKVGPDAGIESLKPWPYDRQNRGAGRP